MIEEGSPFPDFSLPDQDDKIVTLKDLSGQTVVLYFYPKDDTTGCTVEACEFRDILPDIPGAKVVGVSPDSPKKHRKFIAKYNLNFTLLADIDHKFCEELGLWVEKTFYGRKYMGVDRTTFILDGSGKVVKVFQKVKPEGHAAEVKAALP
jgi:peroxiredoxin Q/BCP